MASWNPWHGCTKISAGLRQLLCISKRSESRKRSFGGSKECLIYAARRQKTKRRVSAAPDGDYVYTCFTSDFFHPAADEWRKEAWRFMQIRRDLEFLIITKRVNRFFVSLPEDWEEGYENVTVCCTCENQEMADFRLPIYASLPIRRKIIICEPLLGAIDLRRYLAIREKGGIPMIRELVCGGESGNDARICDYGWILSLREQCLAAGVPFRFRQTGALFRKDGRLYRIPRRLQHAQARKAGIDTD